MTRALIVLTFIFAVAGAALSACGGEEFSGELDLSARLPDLAIAEDLAEPECVTDGGCYSCAPKSDPQFLNQCTTAACAHFDNSRLPLLLSGGGLPPLP